MGNTYKDRDIILAQMGFSSYTEYLASDLWKSIRARAFSKKKNQCKLCQGAAQVLHHLSYRKSVLQGKHNGKLVVLCHECHRKVEFDEAGNKRTRAQASLAFVRLVRSRMRKVN